MTPVFASDGRIEKLLSISRDITRRRQVNERLRTSEGKLRLAQESAGVGIWEVDLVRGTGQVSKETLEMLGAPAGHDGHFRNIAEWTKLIHPEDRARTLTEVEGVIETGRLHDVTYRAVRPDGSIRWIRGLGRVQLDENGRRIGIIGLNIDVTADKASEAALLNERGRLQTIIDSIPAMITVYDPAVHMLFLNREFERVVGWSSEDSASIDLMAECYPDPTVRGRAAAFMETCEGWMDLPVRTRDGRTLETSWASVRLADGRQIGIGIDIGERKAAEEELRRYRQLIEQSSDFIGWAELDGRVVFANDGVRRLVGASEGTDWRRVKVADFFMPEDLDYVEREIIPLQLEGQAWQGEFRFRRFDTSEPVPVWYNAFPIKDGAGKVAALATVTRDMTELKAQQAKLGQSEARLRVALDAGGMTTFNWDLVTGYDEWPSDTYRLLGYEPGEVTPGYEAWSARVHPDDLADVGACVRRAIEDGSDYHAEYRVIYPGGATVWLESFGRTTMAPDGTPLRMDGVMRDITARKAIEAEAAKAQADLLRVSRLSAMGAMASTLAHELNQPLTAISNYMAAVRRRLEAASGDGVLREAVTEAQKEAVHAGEIIRRMRRFAVTGEVSRRPEEVAPMVKDAVRLLETRITASTVVCLDIDAGLPSVLVDRVQIKQVISNLIRNSLDAMATVERREVTILALRVGSRVEIKVADTGRGLTAEQMSNLFEPFSSTKADGLGLGLPLCRTIVEAHGGRIWAEAPPNGQPGAIFVVSLPIDEA